MGTSLANPIFQPRTAVSATPARREKLGAAEKEVRRSPSSRILRLSQKKGGFGETIIGARRIALSILPSIGVLCTNPIPLCTSASDPLGCPPHGGDASP